MTGRKTVIIVLAVLGAWVLVCIAGGLFLARHARQLVGGPVGLSKTHVGKPIPCGPEAMTLGKMREHWRGYYRKQFVTSYQQVGKHNPRWDATAEKYLEGLAARYAPHPDAPDDKTLAALARKLEQVQCDDPLVLSRLGVLYRQQGKKARAEAYVTRALAGLKQSRYPPLVRAITYHGMAHLKGEVGAKLESADLKWRPLAIAAYADAADRKYFGPHEQRAFWSLLHDVMEQDFRRSQAVIVSSLKDRPGTDPWLLNMAWGKHLYDYAVVSAGGEDYILLATGEKREQYRKYLKLARPYLEKAYELHPDYPEAASYMIELVKGGEAPGGETERDWFDKAVAAQLDYMPAYYGMVGALHPFWGGSRQAQLAFGKECLDTGRFDTRVPKMYEEIVFMTSGRQGETEVWSDPQVWPNLQRYYEGALTQAIANRPKDVKPLRTLYAVTAWRTGHADDARRQLEATPDGLDSETFDSIWGERADLFVGEVYARTGPHKDEIAQAHMAFDSFELDKAIAAYEALLRKESDKRIQFYLRDRLQTLRWDKQFAADQWVELNPTAELVGWNPWQGTFKPLPDGQGFIVRPNEKWAMIVCHMRPGEWFEMQGDIEFPDRRVEGIEAGFIVNIAAKCANPYYDTFRLIRFPPTAYRGGGWTEWQEHALRDVPRKLHMRLVQCGHRITLYMNDQTIFQDAELTDPGFRFEGPHNIGFGGETYPDRSQPVIYRHLRVHRISRDAVKSNRSTP